MFYEIISHIIFIVFEDKIKNKKIIALTKLSEIGVDSISFVEILITLEEKLNISFDENIPALSECEYVSNIIELVLNKINERN